MQLIISFNYQYLYDKNKFNVWYVLSVLSLLLVVLIYKKLKITLIKLVWNIDRCNEKEIFQRFIGSISNVYV